MSLKTFQNNVVINDHRIGIWLLGGKDCKVINNTVLQNGAHTATGGGPSGIRLWWTQGNGDPARNGENNIVENNIAGEFGLKIQTTTRYAQHLPI